MPDRLIFLAPLPYRALSQNWRGNRYVHASAVRQYRSLLRLLTLEALGSARPAVGKVRMSVEFRTGWLGKKPRTQPVEMAPAPLRPYTPRDVLNGAGALKAAQDGIADALGVDDSAKNWSLGEFTIVGLHPEGPGVRFTLELEGV